MVKSATVLFWARLASINAWEQVGRARFWRRWLGESACSADTLGRVHALLDADGLRQGIHQIYERLKRNKALPDIYGLGVVVLDGHESHASYLRHCSGCLQRTIHGEKGDRIQYYHRQVTLMLLPDAPTGRPAVRLLLDHEPQRAGEDEVETALRLLKRVMLAYSRAFDLVLADAAYAEALFQLFDRSGQTRAGRSQRRTTQSVPGCGRVIRFRRAATRQLSIPPMLLVGLPGLDLLAPGEGPGACHSFLGELFDTPAIRQERGTTE